MRHSLVPALALAATLAAASAGAEAIPTPAPGSASETRAFAGLNWSFGVNGQAPSVLLGVARFETEANGDSKGARVSVYVDVWNGIGLRKVTLTGLSGSRDLMGEIGVGYGKSGFFGTGGFWAPYAAVGLDAPLSGGLSGYLGLHTLGKPKLPEGGSDK